MDFTQPEIDHIQNEFNNLKKKAVKSRKKENVELIDQAFDFAYKAHYPVRRKSGEPYILHPIAVATIIADEIMLGTTSIITALLHDVVEDTEYTSEDIAQFFGPKVASMVEGLTKMSGVFNHRSSLQAQNFRKMLLSMSDDVRVILIKLADRLHNMRTLESMPENKQLKIAGETLFLFAPLAHRLGLYKIKTELEDISFKYRHREDYERISKKLAESYKARTNFINKFALPIQANLTDLDYDFDVSGRPKSIYSIWQKMQNKGVTFEQIYDLFAIRIIFTPKENEGPEKAQCYKIYSLVTDIYHPRSERLRDWVNTPKSNGYEALHSTVMGPTGKWVEVQIRTRRMNEIAERGFAAHWKYKGQHDHEGELDKWLEKIREIIESPEASTLDFLDNLKLNIFSPQINIFTPKGELKTVPQGATALDFAYDIHTEVGNKAISAEINHKISPISAKLKSGDQIRIITSQKGKPKEEWMGFVTTQRAKSAIKSYLNKQRAKIVEAGKTKYIELLKTMNIKVNERIYKRLRDQMGVKSKDDLFYGLGKEIITEADIKKLLRSRQTPKWMRFWTIKKDAKNVEESTAIEFNKKQTLNISDEDIKSNLKIADCCKPIPGDVVIGYLDENDIIHIHKSTCPEAVKLSSGFGDRIVKVKWTSHKAMAFKVILRVEGIDSPAIAHQVTGVIVKELNANIRTIHIESKDKRFHGWVELYIYNRKDLNKLIMKLKGIKGLTKVHRENESPQ
ncbi:MAG: RelA/SpoT family protein [Salinivirgaceae bacterium]|jgi:guanosine-3',5'-bis(diphosphate) 3'-pyrophosphohydrolase|nr:RelA/SpoT family protein [Salinivirgaceae bacterium]